MINKSDIEKIVKLPALNIYEVEDFDEINGGRLAESIYAAIETIGHEEAMDLLLGIGVNWIPAGAANESCYREIGLTAGAVVFVHILEGEALPDGTKKEYCSVMLAKHYLDDDGYDAIAIESAVFFNGGKDVADRITLALSQEALFMKTSEIILEHQDVWPAEVFEVLHRAARARNDVAAYLDAKNLNEACENTASVSEPALHQISRPKRF